MNILTIISAVQAGVALIPEGAALIAELRGLLTENDQAALDKALADSTAAADEQHRLAQG